ncbi:MAG: calcium-binding protein, partial [Cyanothece sp. SIO1E1]|nr:calcium-binding protein [Cyanothece sp. SIO1E1]
LFNGQSKIEDSFDVFNADDKRSRIFNRNTVTFLNSLNNKVFGFSSSDDTINGQEGDDVINGLSGSDLLRGGVGSDTIIGGKGNDTLVGGEGADQFQLNAPGMGIDIIEDFSTLEGDVLIVALQSFSSLIQDELPIGVLEAERFTLGNIANSVNNRFVYNVSTGQLFFDIDGTGDTPQVQIAQLANGHNLNHADIQIF